MESNTKTMRGGARTRGGRRNTAKCIKMQSRENFIDEEECDESEDQTLNNLASIESKTENRELDEELNVEMGELSGKVMESTNDEVETVQELEEIDIIEINLDKIEIEDYVVVRYEGKFYPGQVREFREENVLVSCMEQSGKKYWKWPAMPDEIWYFRNDILKKIEPANIIPVSHRGVFQVEDDLLAATPIFV